MARSAHFTPALFDFLRELGANNRRDWFQANKARYERDVRQPVLRFVADFAPKLRRISPAFVADPSPVGGSMFRIHRDVRFSPDKSPYKTHAAARFPHGNRGDIHAPGFYLHLEPDGVFAGAGVWHPDSATQRRIREAIVADPKRWKRVVGAQKFRDCCILSGDRLKRLPRGFDPAHPLLDDLMRKDFVCVMRYTEKQVCSADFLARFTDGCRAAAPFVHFLTDAAGLDW